MKNKFTIFYSWQSDLTTDTNRGFILNCIESAIAILKVDNLSSIELEINIDRDTKDKNGSPLIVDSILEKISMCDIFICDVSIINSSWLNSLLKNRVTPNPNVLIELGYAVRLLGWERIICVNNLNYAKPELLPFDIRGHKVITYNSSEDNSRQHLNNVLKEAIGSIINDYEQILIRFQENDYKLHDRNIYYKFIELCSEELLFESISVAVNSLFSNKYYYDIWDSLIEFYKKTINHFLDKEVDTSMREFLSKLNDFDNICIVKFHSKNENKYSLSQLKDEGVEITEEMTFDYKQSQIYSIIKEPFHTETWADADRRVLRVQTELYECGEEVVRTYRNLIMTIKKKLLI